MNSVDALPRVGADPARRARGRRDRHKLRPRTALFVGALGGFTSTIPIIFSPIRKLKEMPEGAETLPAVAADDAGLAPTVAGGFDESGALAGAGSSATRDDS